MITGPRKPTSSQYGVSPISNGSAHHSSISEGDIVIGKTSFFVELEFSAEVTVHLICNRPSPPTKNIFVQAESLRLSLHKLEGILNEYSPLMSESTERALEKIVKFGAAFSEVRPPIWN